MKLGSMQNVEAWKAGGPPPPGTYLARIDSAEEGTSSGGHPELQLSWTVIDGEYDGAEIREWLVYTPAAIGKFKALIQATGVEVNQEDAELQPDALIGRHALIVVRTEPGRNDSTKVFSVVKGYRPAPQEAVSAAANGHTAAKPNAGLPF